MKCHSCGSSNRDHARFCADCGAKLLVACPSCGTENSASGGVCRSCGQSLVLTASSEAPGRHASLEPVLRSRTMIEGERKEITVLFADIIGSTEIVAGLDPEQAMARLDGTVRAMTTAARRYGGYDRPQGDGIMALFGAPLADQNHAALACLAALAMQSAVEDLHESVDIRIGIHSGPVVVRSIRTGAAIDFDAIGETVHLAARMEQAAERGTIRLADSTYRLAKDFIQVRPLGLLPVKGLATPVDQYELTGRTSLRTLWDAHDASRLTPLVGREIELAELHRAATETLAGRGRLVLVTGEAGAGKSRLVHEFLREFKTDRWIVLRSGAMPFSLNPPYAMVAMLLNAWLGLDERDAVAADRLREAVANWPGAGKWSYAALATILDLPSDDPEWRALEPDARRRGTVEVVMSWIASLCRERALLLVFEDVHWADSESAAILALLAHRAAGLRVLIVATRRSGETGGIAEQTTATELRVDPLPPEATEKMLLHLLGADPQLASLQRFLVEKTGGIPFFVEETARALTESGAIDDSLTGHRVRANIGEIRVPSNVRLLLASRIDRLPPPEKELLHVASVIGHEVSPDILQAVVDLPETEVAQRVVGLERAGFLRSGSAGLRFEHMLTRDVAYETLLLSRRRALHQSVLEAMARRSGEQPNRLAHHAFHGGLWVEALHYLVQAANRALELSAYTEASSLLERALEALTHLPRSGEFLARGIEVRLALRAALGATLDFARIGQLLDEAREIAVETGDDRRLAAVAISQAMTHNHQGDFARGVSAARLARELADKLGEQTLAIPARIYLGQAHLWRGELPEALAALDAELDWIKGPLRHKRLGTTGASSVTCIGFLASANAFIGKFDTAESLVGEASAIAREAGRPYDLVVAGWFRGWIARYRGKLADSLHALEQAHRLCEEMEIRYFRPAVASVLGSVYAELGRTGDAIALLTRALGGQKAGALPYGEAWTSALLGFAHLRHGDATSAAALGRQALSLSGAHSYRVVEVMAERLLGMISGAAGDSEMADRHFDRAIDRAEALGLRPELAHCRLERGLLMKELARPDAARSELERATALYAEMGMAFWQARAEAALDEIGGRVRQ